MIYNDVILQSFEMKRRDPNGLQSLQKILFFNKYSTIVFSVKEIVY